MRIIAGKFKGRTLVTPIDQSIRPTSDRARESLFNILENGHGLNFDGCRVLDLFAGTGAVGIEALSRGAGVVTFVEQSAAARALIHQNIEALALEGQTRILRRDATDLGSVGRIQPFNLVFADPPYNQGLGDKALISALKGGWLASRAILVLEENVKARIALPASLICQDERPYGDTILRFYRIENDLKQDDPAANGF